MKRSEIRARLKALLNPALPDVPIVIDNGDEPSTVAMETALRDDGAVVAIPPLFGSSQGDATRGRLLEDVETSVHLRVNPSKIAALHPAHEDYLDAIIGAIQADDALHATFGPETVTRLLEDPGAITTAVYFRIPYNLPKPV